MGGQSWTYSCSTMEFMVKMRVEDLVGGCCACLSLSDPAYYSPGPL